MLTLSAAVKIHVCVLPTDLRKGFDRLCGLAEHVLKQDPLSGHLFVFRNRARDRIKVLYWDPQTDQAHEAGVLRPCRGLCQGA